MLLASVRASCCLHLFCSASAAWSSLIISSGLGGAGGPRILNDVDCRSIDFRGFLATLPSLSAAPPTCSLSVLPFPLSDEFVRRDNLGLSPTPPATAASMATVLIRPLVEQRTSLGELPSSASTTSLADFHFADARLYAAPKSGRALGFLASCLVLAACLDSSCSVAKHARMIARYLVKVKARV